MSQSLGALLEALRSRRPLIHCITNPISINDCANLILAAGGRPIMAEHPGEVAEITATAAALAVNLGNITDVRMESMVLAGQAAREAGVPMVLDCVGVGCSTLRRRYAQDYLARIKPQVAKGNLSELLCLSGARQGMSGVDADGSDRLEGQTLSTLREFSRRQGAVLLASGPVDGVFAPDGRRWEIRNGHSMMSRLTGTGCMLNVLTAAFLAVGEPEEAAVAAAAMLGICGERAAREARGPGSLRAALLDAAYTLTPEELDHEAAVRPVEKG